jgi:HEAT repeat protein
MAIRAFHLELHTPRLLSLFSELMRERRPARARRSQVRRAPLPPQLEMTDALIAQLMAASAWRARASAALSLAHHPGDEVVQVLVRAVRDPSIEVAVAAIDALISHADERASQVFLCVLQNQAGYFSPVTRVAAVSALAQRLTPEHFAPLFAAVRDIDAEVSIAAAAVISERMPRAQSAQLLHVLRDTSGFYLPIVRLAVANALERAGVLHSSVVQELLPSERDPCVLRVLERASHLTGEVAQLEASE